MSKTILIVYPHNFLNPTCGVDTRYLELATYLKSKGFVIDLLALENFEKGVTWDRQLIRERGLIRHLFLHDHHKTVEAEALRKAPVKEQKTLRQRFAKRFEAGLIQGVYSHLADRYKGFIKWNYRRIREWEAPPATLEREATEMKKQMVSALPDLAPGLMQAYFDEITGQERYDYVLIAYIYWANLIKNKTLNGAVKIIDISDFCTLQLYYAYRQQLHIGPLLEEEINRIDLFDTAICISEDERFFFSQFATRPRYFYVPQSFQKKQLMPVAASQFDLLFIGSGNPHNQQSIAWFFSDIYPLLSPSYRLLVVGKITDHVANYPNVTKIRFADNLDEIYQWVKVCICPMLQGTGMKIKVVEALSYGKPVVCTPKGVDGFRQKDNNGCLIAEKPEAFAALVSRLLEDQAFYDFQRDTAVAFFENNFEQAKVFSTLDTVFNQGSEVVRAIKPRH